MVYSRRYSLMFHCLCHAKLLPYRRAFCVYHTTTRLFTVSLHRVRTVHVRLAVTRRLHFLWNDQDLLRATAVEREWPNGYLKESQHRRLTLEKKILRPLLQGLDRTDDLSTTSDVPPLSCPFGLLPSSASEVGDTFFVQIAQFSFPLYAVRSNT